MQEMPFLSICLQLDLLGGFKIPVSLKEESWDNEPVLFSKKECDSSSGKGQIPRKNRLDFQRHSVELHSPLQAFKTSTLQKRESAFPPTKPTDAPWIARRSRIYVLRTVCASLLYAKG